MGVTRKSADACAFLSGAMAGADPGCAYRTHIAALGAVQAVFRIPLHQFQRRHRLVMAGVVTRTVVGKASVGRHRLSYTRPQCGHSKAAQVLTGRACEAMAWMDFIQNSL